MRTKLGKGYRELEAFALAFAVKRQKETTLQFLGTRQKTDGAALRKWRKTWLKRFADGKGPEWTDDWSKLEVKRRFAHDEDDVSQTGGRRRLKLRRRGFGLDIEIIMAAFGHLPALSEATTKQERAHWLRVMQEIPGVYLRTLPAVTKSTADSEWAYDHWRSDDGVMELVAKPVFEATPAEAGDLWKPMLGLPAAAHHHIRSFLTAVLLECLRPEPPLISRLLPIWHEMGEYFSTRPERSVARDRDVREVWKVLLFYGSSLSSTGEEFFRSIVEDLRPHFESRIKALGTDSYEQAPLARFLTTKAGEPLLVDALVWLRPSWEQASDYFWQRAAEDAGLERLLEHAWKYMFAQVRQNPAAFAAFKLLTLNLATRQSGIALQIQEQISKAS